jgi:hypothetical protein
VQLEGDLFINQTYKQVLKLRKEYKGTVYFKIALEGKSSEDLEVDLTA